MAGYKNSKIVGINNAARNMLSNINKQGSDYVKNMFRAGTSFQESIKYDIVNEYIKKMIISQLDIEGMLECHKYYYDYKNPELKEEYRRIKEQMSSDLNISFDEETTDALFGNTYGIKSDRGYKILEQISDPCRVGKIIQIYSEEKFKYYYENENNRIKKFLMSFKYKKLFPEDVIEEKGVVETRDIFRNFIHNNPGINEDIIIYARQPGGNLHKGMSEYKLLKGMEGVVAAVMQSLQQTHCLEPIDLKKTCNKCRTMLRGEYLYKYPSEYRTKDTIKYKDISSSEYLEHNLSPHQDIKSRMEELQKRYEELYLTSETNEEYISGVSGIFVDFLDIHPYENGNKITATCLLNNMLLSKGIIPPPISLANDEKLGEAFAQKGKEKYNAVEEIISNGCKNMQKLWSDGREPNERGNTKTIENSR